MYAASLDRVNACDFITFKKMNIDPNISILMIEDDEVDVMAFKRAINKAKLPNQVFYAANGLEGLAYLRGEEGKQKVAQPCVVLLDLNMPKMNGFEFLEVLRADEDLRDTAVFVLTTSNLDKDKVRAEQLSVAGYLVKSELGETFLPVIEKLSAYWMSMSFAKAGGYDWE